jgi:AhpD family alkylhydroperoxidase
LSVTTDDTVGALVRLDIDTVAPTFSRALESLDAATTRQLDVAGIAAGLRELMRVRASQLNGCAYCVGVHTTDALDAGEPVARLAAVPVWRESPFFTRRERAALALTDSMTRLVETHVSEADWAEASVAFTPEELGALVALVTTVNAWNTVSVTTRAWTPTL